MKFSYSSDKGNKVFSRNPHSMVGITLLPDDALLLSTRLVIIMIGSEVEQNSTSKGSIKEEKAFSLQKKLR